MEGGAAEETTLLTGPIQGDVVTINQKALDLMLLQVFAALLCHIQDWHCHHAYNISMLWSSCKPMLKNSRLYARRDAQQSVLRCCGLLVGNSTCWQRCGSCFATCKHHAVHAGVLGLTLVQ